MGYEGYRREGDDRDDGDDQIADGEPFGREPVGVDRVVEVELCDVDEEVARCPDEREDHQQAIAGHSGPFELQHEDHPGQTKRHSIGSGDPGVQVVLGQHVQGDEDHDPHDAAQERKERDTRPDLPGSPALLNPVPAHDAVKEREDDRPREEPEMAGDGHGIQEGQVARIATIPEPPVQHGAEVIEDHIHHRGVKPDGQGLDPAGELVPPDSHAGVVEQRRE